MKKSILSIIATGAVLLLGGTYVASTSKDSPGNNESSASIQAESSESENTLNDENKVDNSKAAELSYVITTSAELSGITNEKRVLFFHASWCPTCKVLDNDISLSVSQIPAGLTIARVDFDNETDLRKKYGVTLQHTLVQIDAAGNEIAMWSGSRDLADLLAKVK